MKTLGRFFLSAFMLLVFCMVSFSCANKRDLYIYYQLPQPSQGLKGITVGVDFQDQRPDAYFLTMEAAQEFYTFSGKFSFTVTQGTENETTGILDLPRVATLTLTKRLENLGATVVPHPAPEHPIVRLIFNDFKLNYADRKWKIQMNYEAQLVLEGEVRAQEIIKGSADRLQNPINPTGDADRVVSELYNDMINQLNVERLFQKAGYTF